MTRLVVLDSSPLGLVSNPRGSGEALRCQDWLNALAEHALIVIPEVADDEVRRELIRARRTSSIQRLDELKAILE